MRNKKAKEMRRLVRDAGKHPGEKRYYRAQDGSHRLTPACGRGLYRLLKKNGEAAFPALLAAQENPA